MFVTCPRCSAQNYPNATQCGTCAAPLTPPPAPGPVQAFASTGAPGFAGTGGGASGPLGQAAAQPQVGQIIDHKYRIERVLGEGGMGVVYVAIDVNADQPVVIKSIRPEFANRGDFRERTLAEGKALAKIDHQNVVRFYSIINSAETGELYIVMQFIEGESLDHTLEKANAASQKLPVAEVVRLFKQILDGVGAAHGEGLIHRDLKPANVLVRAKDGVAKVMDFGIAKAEGSTKGPTQAGGIVGSLFYMAPEQIKGERNLDKRLDIYALGIVLYELITGFVPFEGETEYAIMTQHLTVPVPSVTLKRPDAPAWIDAVIARATAKERGDRFQSCEEMRAFVDANDGGVQVPGSITGGRQASPTFAAMSAPNPGTMGGVPYVSGTTGADIASMQPKGGGNGAVFAVLGIVVLLAGGGAAAYFMTGGSGDGKPDKTKAKASDEGRNERGRKGDNADETPKKKVKERPKTEDIVDKLVGNWKTTTTNRRLTGVKVDDDEIDFKVVDPTEWSGAFEKDEVRFHLLVTDKDIQVSDRFRPAPGPGKHFSRDALAGCLVETKEVDSKPLTAKIESSGALIVNLAAMTVRLKVVGAEAEIPGCDPPKVTGSVSAELKKID